MLTQDDSQVFWVDEISSWSFTSFYCISGNSCVEICSFNCLSPISVLVLIAPHKLINLVCKNICSFLRQCAKKQCCCRSERKTDGPTPVYKSSLRVKPTPWVVTFVVWGVTQTETNVINWRPIRGLLYRNWRPSLPALWVFSKNRFHSYSGAP